MTRPTLEGGDIFRKYTPAFLDRYEGVLSTDQRRVLKELALCRTAALGGHVEECDQCGQQRIAYNSCRNRHCPKCQAMARALDGGPRPGTAAGRVFSRGVYVGGWC